MAVDDKDLRKPFLLRLGQMKTKRRSYEADWEAVRDYILPDHGRFNGDDANKGESRRDLIINSTAEESVGILAAGLMAGVTSPARRWFRITTADPDLAKMPKVKEHLDMRLDIHFRTLRRSNVYRVLPFLYQEFPTFGTGLMYSMEDSKSIVRAYGATIGEFYLAYNERLELDTVYREFTLTVRQVIGQFGLENVSRSVKDLYDNGNYLQTVKILHILEPNNDGLPDEARPVFNLPYVGIYLESGANTKEPNPYLEVKGYHEFPAMGPLWDVVSTRTYGKGLGQMYLGDCRMLQHYEEMKAEAIEKMVRPPLLSDSDKNPVNAMPNGVSIVDSVSGSDAGVKPLYQVDFHVEHAAGEVREIELRLKNGFHTNLFRTVTNMQHRTQITAREIDELREEKLLMLGPTLQRIDDNLLDPMIRRNDGIMSRNGDFPPLPDDLQGQEMRIEYVGLMAQAQRAIGVAGVERTFALAGNMASLTGDPAIFDNLDIDKAIRDSADWIGTPADHIRSQDKVDAIRAKRAQQEQMEQAAVAAESMAGTAETLSRADLDGNNALRRALDAVGSGL